MELTFSIKVSRAVGKPVSTIVPEIPDHKRVGANALQPLLALPAINVEMFLQHLRERAGDGLTNNQYQLLAEAAAVARGGLPDLGSPQMAADVRCSLYWLNCERQANNEAQHV